MVIPRYTWQIMIVTRGGRPAKMIGRIVRPAPAGRDRLIEDKAVSRPG